MALEYTCMECKKKGAAGQALTLGRWGCDLVFCSVDCLELRVTKFLRGEVLTEKQRSYESTCCL